MKPPVAGERLRIYVGESDHFEGRPLYQAIVEAARRAGLAGATVLRGVLGFGAHSRIHSSRVLRLSEDLPMLIEIVDRPERIAEFLPELDRMVSEGLVTTEPVGVWVYRPELGHPERGRPEAGSGQD